MTLEELLNYLYQLFEEDEFLVLIVHLEEICEIRFFLSTLSDLHLGQGCVEVLGTNELNFYLLTDLIATGR